MPLFLHIDEINKVKQDSPEYSDINIFIESGTNIGRSLFHLVPYFKEMHTIEIAKHFYDMCVEKGRECSNIRFYHGDSLDILPIILKNLTCPILFWLDGHYCKGGTGRGKIDPPMREELSIILNEHNNNSIIMIDNVDVFGRRGPPGEEDWTHVSVEYIMNENQNNPKIKKYYIENDRLIILLRSI